MKLLAVGGGSGGHVTPVLAVINELKAQLGSQELSVCFVCDQAFETQSRGLMEHADAPVTVSTIRAGKLRRYQNETWWQKLTDVKTIWFNIRDIVYIVAGFFQSTWLLLRWRPDVVFAKGGFVCLPMGIAARLLRVPLVIHDSDTRPGLTNRVLSRWATAIGTGAPLENYSYPLERSQYVGVPIDPAFRPFDDAEQRIAKEALGLIDITAPLVVVTGGGLGAKSINDAMARGAEQLVEAGLHIYHITGKKHYETVRRAVPNHPHYHVVAFVYRDMARVLGAGDIVVARGSATFLQELAGLAKPVISIPAQQLSDQVKNAAVYQEAGAVVVLDDQTIMTSMALPETIIALSNDKARRHELSRKIHQFARPHAAADMARLLQETVQKSARPAA